MPLAISYNILKSLWWASASALLTLLSIHTLFLAAVFFMALLSSLYGSLCSSTCSDNVICSRLILASLPLSIRFQDSADIHCSLCSHCLCQVLLCLLPSLPSWTYSTTLQYLWHSVGLEISSISHLYSCLIILNPLVLKCHMVRVLSWSPTFPASQ